MGDSSVIGLDDPEGTIDPDFARRAAEHILNSCWAADVPAPDSYIVDVSVVDDNVIRNYNREYLGADCPTDVLAFPVYSDEDRYIPVMHLGQVIISSETAEKQCVLYGSSLRDEMKLLLVHGLLHIAGWPEGEGIEAKQLEVLETL